MKPIHAEELIALAAAGRSIDAVENALEQLGRFEHLEPDERIVALLQHRSSRVRAAAVQVLAKMSGPHVERALLTYGERADGVYELALLNATLGEIGGPASVAFLERQCLDPRDDVACSAVWALSTLDGPRHVPFFIEVLETCKRGVTKSYATHALVAHAGSEGVEPLLARLKSILRHQRSTVGHPSEVVEIVRFLDEHAESGSSARRYLEQTLPTKRLFLFPEERAELAKFVDG